MTIPTSRGGQNITCMYVIKDNMVLRYVNRIRFRPTHSLRLMNKLNDKISNQLLELFPRYNCFIILSKNENSGRALWEVGYQMLNLILQAKAINIAFKSIFLNDDQKIALKDIKIKNPVAIFLLK